MAPTFSMPTANSFQLPALPIHITLPTLTKEQNHLLVASSVVSTLTLIATYTFLKPRAPLFTESDFNEHYAMLPRTQPLPPNTPAPGPAPHKNRYTKKKLQKYFTDASITDETVDIILIGTGLGSLTTASLLAQRGYKCLLFEQHDQAGGCLHTFESAKPTGYEFDVGLHYIGGMVGDKWSPIRKMFDAVTGGGVQWDLIDGRSSEMNLVYDRALCTNDSKDGLLGEKEGFESFEFGSNYNTTASILKSKLTSNSEKKSVDRFYSCLGPTHILLGGWMVLKTLTPYLRNLLAPLLLYPAKSVLGLTTTEYMTKLQAPTKVIGILNYLYGDHGLPPGKSAFAISAMIGGHWVGGAFYPRGGASTLSIGGCAVIKKYGGEVFVNARVNGIDVVDGKAVGVTLKDGTSIKAKLGVVSDVGARGTFLKLLKEEDLKGMNQEFINSLKGGDVQGASEDTLIPSCAIMTLFIGLDKPSQEYGIPQSNTWIVPSFDHDENMSAFVNSKEGVSEKTGKDIPFPATFIGSNENKDRSFKERFGADKGTVSVLCPIDFAWFSKAEWLNTKVHSRGDSYDAYKKIWETKMLAQLYRHYPLVKPESIVYMELGTPLSNNAYLGVEKGEVYGLSHTPTRFLRFAKELSCQVEGVDNLYLTGQDVATAGVVGALLGGVLTVASISKMALLASLHKIV